MNIVDFETFMLIYFRHMYIHMSKSLSGLTYYTIFAGRRIYIDIIVTYLDILLDQGLIDRVLMFNLCRSSEDENYFRMAMTIKFVHIPMILVNDLRTFLSCFSPLKMMPICSKIYTFCYFWWRT